MVLKSIFGKLVFAFSAFFLSLPAYSQGLVGEPATSFCGGGESLSIAASKNDSSSTNRPISVQQTASGSGTRFREPDQADVFLLGLGLLIMFGTLRWMKLGKTDSNGTVLVLAKQFSPMHKSKSLSCSSSLLRRHLSGRKASACYRAKLKSRN